MMRWTPYRDGLLCEMYGTGVPMDRMTVELGTTIRAIYTRAHHLHVKRVQPRVRIRLRGGRKLTPLAELVPEFRRWLDAAGLPRLPGI